MTDIAGTRCVVTGAGRGMGRLLAKKLLEKGASVALLDVDAETLEATAEELSGLGRVKTFVVDLSDCEAIYAVVPPILDWLGGIDILVNNAGIVSAGSLLDVSEEMHTLTYEVNTLAVARMTRAVLPTMLAQGQGHIVNMASAAGLTGVALATTYASSKWAVVGFSESLQQELRLQGHSLVVTCVCPGYVDTGMFDGIRAPMLTPTLRPTEVVTRVAEAIEANERLVTMPFIVGTVTLMRAVLPSRVLDFLSDRLGVSTSMSHWRGRGSKS